MCNFLQSVSDVCVVAIASDPDFQFGSKRFRQAVKGRLPVNLYLKIFDTQIRPIFEYASEIWCQDISIGELEQAQLNYLKTILGVSQSTPTTVVLGETGRFPLHLRYEEKIMKLWSRLNKLPVNNFLSKVYRELTNYSQGHNKWAGRVDVAISKYTVNLPIQSVNTTSI